MLREKVKRFHFVGIGGIGMSGIAQILLEMNYDVSGSDIKDNKNTEMLRSKGARIHIGHRAENVSEDTQVVVYSSAVREDNPELRRAKELGIPVIPRGEMLAELFKLKEGIAVSGSHGKTTTTSMVAHILEEAGFDPTVIIGGILQRLGSNAKLGRGDLLVSEADESDGSFLKLSPAVNVITNIDLEHMDYYRDLEDIVAAFAKFAGSVPFYGFCVANADDPNVRNATSSVTKKLITFGIEKEADVVGTELSIEGGRYAFGVVFKGERLGKIRLSIGGRHNVYNALAATAVSLELGVPFEVVRSALEGFHNAERRMELKGFFGGVPIYDDYGHHPTEIRAVVSALREMYPGRRLVMVFQPHRYSRTHFLFDSFVEVLKLPDLLLMLDIYPASEKNIYGVDARELALRSGATFVEEKENVLSLLEENLREGDVLLFMGAGDITRLCEDFVKAHSGALPEDLEHQSAKED
ncbi:UDP-N-acetylmuramate--L-alanine ligase [Hydrogenivirga sp. 128-5-R1-1]|uniref:UDP-N-acetylmuramate--L-alanine ligase n=1 Tax=Hydrogenivirga sp. 128-5-R1-1 TaxID=392423 RepID=UPI00015F0D33|nr:UDP-N-acetylmuramate--L-alanine ligase [Hydrogenivirga sp. 128-5-R1-1]EDP75859.1 UDP-N-acetylmuramate-alanine ligase [Hydrogenivirga sp. 128-5-R1-1]